MIQIIVFMLIVGGFIIGWSMKSSITNDELAIKNQQISDIKWWKDYYCNLYNQEINKIPDEVEHYVEDYRDQLYKKWIEEQQDEITHDS